MEQGGEVWIRAHTMGYGYYECDDFRLLRLETRLGRAVAIAENGDGEERTIVIEGEEYDGEYTPEFSHDRDALEAWAKMQEVK